MLNSQSIIPSNSNLKCTSAQSILDNDYQMPTSCHDYDYFQDQRLSNTNRGLFTNQLELFGASSFKTLSRGSLQMMPDLCSMEVDDEKIQGHKKYSNNSILESSKNQSADDEKNLIEQTQDLTINDQYEESSLDLFFQSSPKKTQTTIRGNQQKFHHFRVIKQHKRLLKQFKRLNKAGNQIKGKFSLKTESEIIKVKNGNIKTIVTQKGLITGLLLEDGDHLMKIRVSDQCISGSPRMQLWKQTEQNWIQFMMTAKLKFQ